MKKNYRFIAVLSSLIICAATFTACSGGNDENSSNSSSDNTSATSSLSDNSENKASSDDEADDYESSVDSEIQSAEEGSETTEGSDDVSQEGSESEFSINNEQNSKNASDAQNPSESSKSTGNKDFDDVFKNNKLDVALENDRRLAETTEAMSETLTKYEKLWLAEAENANNKLQASSLSDDEKKTIQSDYDEWLSGFEAKRKEIIKEEKANWGSGSIYIVNAYEKIKDYCRDYAMNLYEKLYELDGSFELAYSE